MTHRKMLPGHSIDYILTEVTGHEIKQELFMRFQKGDLDSLL